MSLELGVWRVDGKGPVRLAASQLALEADLERFIEADPTILGEQLMLVGRQVPTAFGKFIDLLAIDADGDLHVLELKRDRTPREVVAQVLDYGAWVTDLGQGELRDIFAAYHPDEEFDVAFEAVFGAGPPEDLNGAHYLTVIASQLDPATERIVAYLATGYGVPINVAFFTHFSDDGRQYLTRTWLLDDAQVADAPARKKGAGGTKEPWNGTDWYVAFGEDSGRRSWDDAATYGFISAGGGERYSKPLQRLPLGARVFAYIPQTGYVGVGVVTATAVPSDEAVLTEHGVPTKFSDLDLHATYQHDGVPGNDSDRAEYVVGVQWLHHRPRVDAIRGGGLFANQNTACKLRHSFTLEELTKRFGLASD